MKSRLVAAVLFAIGGIALFVPIGSKGLTNAALKFVLPGLGAAYLTAGGIALILGSERVTLERILLGTVPMPLIAWWTYVTNDIIFPTVTWYHFSMAAGFLPVAVALPVGIARSRGRHRAAVLVLILSFIPILGYFLSTILPPWDEPAEKGILIGAALAYLLVVTLFAVPTYRLGRLLGKEQPGVESGRLDVS